MNINHDKILIKTFFTKTDKYSSHFAKRLNMDCKYQNIKEYLSDRFEEKSRSYKESIYRIKLGYERIPRCKKCGKTLQFQTHSRNPYLEYCSTKCSNSSMSKIKKYEDTCLREYGVKSAWQKRESRVKSIATFKSFSSQQKRNNTLRINKSYSKSKPEDLSFSLIKEKYPDVERQYRSDKYPFNCDFYIPSIDTYIEYNGFWTHGGHPFNQDDKDDLRKIETWKFKSSRFYDNAIYVWTDLDIRKRKIARENDLNYIEFWNVSDVKNWIESKK